MKKFLCLVLCMATLLGSTLTVEAKRELNNVYDKKAEEYRQELEDWFYEDMTHNPWGTWDIIKDFEVKYWYRDDFIYEFAVRETLNDGSTVDVVQIWDMLDEEMLTTYYRLNGRRVTKEYMHQKYPLIESGE